MKDNDELLISRLQSWYYSMCNGDWEHTYGIFISNIDNPGWSIKVELQDTYLYNVQFDGVNVQRDNEHDWLICKVEDGVFQAYGGPANLDEILCVFLDWAESNSE